MRKFIQFTGPILFLVLGCIGTASPQRSVPSEPVPRTAPPQERGGATPTPKKVTYTIIDKNIIPGVKRSLDVRLSRKVSEEELRSIAMKLKNSDPNHYERTFIGYYLPGMKVGAGGWATTHFNPNLEVRILGLTVEQEAALRRQSEEPSREVIGSWLDERPIVANRIMIYRESGKLFMENKYKDSSSGKRELVEGKSPSGRRFDKAGGSSAGDHYLIDSNGDLQLRDNEGLISTAKKIK